MRNATKMHPLAGLMCGVGVLILCSNVVADPVDYVNPLIGTADIAGDGGTEYGGTMPFVEPPFAMTSWTSQTRQNNWSDRGGTSYNYGDTYLSGFMGTHQMAIWMRDYGFVTLMPEVDTVKTIPLLRQLPFTHAEETSSPYYYSVLMGAGSSRTLCGEIAATDHCAIMRFTYPRNTNASILVEAARTPGTKVSAAGFLKIDSALQELYGYNSDREDAILSSLKLPHFKGYFVIKINKPFSGYGSYCGSQLLPGRTSVSGANASLGGFVAFTTTNSEAVEVKVGTSFISIAQARSNLDAEIPDWDFNGTEARLRKVWNQKLGEVTIRGGTHEQLAQFYTAMYHGMLFPRNMTEQGRYYSAFDDRIHTGVAYTAFSGWDIYRAEWSSLSLFCPERINDMVQALLNDYVEGGWLPKLPNPSYTSIMYSTPADSMIAQAINEGFQGFDYRLAYAAVLKDAMTPPNGDLNHKWLDREQAQPYSAREGLSYYKQYGYIPDDWTSRAASCTLAHTYYDWCVAQIAKAVRNTNAWVFFNNRSFNYTNLYNPLTGLMNSRYANGTWAPANHGWSEGGQDLYVFDVMHNIPGLIDLMGGTTQFNRKLAARVRDPNSLVNNEPGNHYPYLFDFSGKPWMCQQVVRSELTQFSDSPGGLPGNDDCGQTSTCLLFADMGFYPFPPASATFMIGSPVFPEMSLHLPNGNTFTITTAMNSPKNIYIQSAKLNGDPLNSPILTYSQIEGGGTLNFVMGPAPSSWGSDWRGKPLQWIGQIACQNNSDRVPSSMPTPSLIQSTNR